MHAPELVSIRNEVGLHQFSRAALELKGLPCDGWVEKRRKDEECATLGNRPVIDAEKGDCFC